MRNETGDLDGAVQAWFAYRQTVSAEEIFRRARAAALAAVRRGVTALRSHVDVFPEVGLRSVHALLAVRDELRGTLDLQLCALSYPLAGSAGAENRRLVREALRLGVDLVGGAPHRMSDPAAEIDACLDLAREHGVSVDLHMDEHTRSTVDLRYLAACAHSLPERVAASHCVSLGMAPAGIQSEVAASVAEADVAVITCPQTNLYLQGRDQRRATPRGLTAIAELQRAGATVAAGVDNMQDPFNPLGRGDALETAALLVVAGHLSPERAYDCVSGQARAAMGLAPVRIAPGCPADLMAIDATSIRHAIATCTEDRIVFRRGRLVARTQVCGGLLPDSDGHPNPPAASGRATAGERHAQHR